MKRKNGGPKPPLWRRRWPWITAAVIALVAVAGALSPKQPSHSTTTAARKPSTTTSPRKVTTTRAPATTDKPTTTARRTTTTGPPLRTTTTRSQRTTTTADHLRTIAAHVCQLAADLNSGALDNSSQEVETTNAKLIDAITPIGPGTRATPAEQALAVDALTLSQKVNHALTGGSTNQVLQAMGALSRDCRPFNQGAATTLGATYLSASSGAEAPATTATTTMLPRHHADLSNPGDPNTPCHATYDWVGDTLQVAVVGEPGELVVETESSAGAVARKDLMPYTGSALVTFPGANAATSLAVVLYLKGLPHSCSVSPKV